MSTFIHVPLNFIYNSHACHRKFFTMFYSFYQSDSNVSPILLLVWNSIKSEWLKIYYFAECMNFNKRNSPRNWINGAITSCLKDFKIPKSSLNGLIALNDALK